MKTFIAKITFQAEDIDDAFARLAAHFAMDAIGVDVPVDVLGVPHLVEIDPVE